MLKYGKAINYDFSQDIADLEHQVMEEPVTDYFKEPETFEEAKHHISYWKYKYFTILDKYIDAIEKKK